jgi:hypothetical protein
MEITVAPCAQTSQTLQVAHLEDDVQYHRKMRREGVEKRFIPMTAGAKLEMETHIKSCWTTKRASSHMAFDSRRSKNGGLKAGTTNQQMSRANLGWN